MADKSRSISRRDVVKTGTIAGAACLGGGTIGLEAQNAPLAGAGLLQEIASRVESTPIVDSHEHLIEESVRLSGRHERIKANDWSFLLSHYLNSDLISSGMTAMESMAWPRPDGKKRTASAARRTMPASTA